MKNILHLDLEGTIIETFHHPLLTNIQSVKTFIERFNPDEVHIFSHAIYNQNDLLHFNDSMRPLLESVLGVKFEKVPTVEDIIHEVQQVTHHCPTQVGIYISEYSKKESFFLYCKNFDYVANHYLVDDCVGEEILLFKRDLSYFETIPVKKIEQWQPLHIFLPTEENAADKTSRYPARLKKH